MNELWVDGVHVVEAGEGPALLCLHGVGSSAASFAPQFDDLAGEYRVVAWDAPGYAQSEDPAGPLDMDAYAGLAAGLLERVVGGAASILGMSWGAVIATRLALSRPDLVQALVLADSSVGSGRDSEHADAMRRRPADLDDLGIEEYAAKRATAVLSADAPDWLVDRVAAQMVQSLRPAGFAPATRSMADTDHRADLHRIAVPTLVLVGEHDTVTDLSVAQELATGIPHAKLEIVSGAGHLSNQEAPAIFNRMVADFLTDVAHATRHASSDSSLGSTP